MTRANAITVIMGEGSYIMWEGPDGRVWYSGSHGGSVDGHPLHHDGGGCSYCDALRDAYLKQKANLIPDSTGKPFEGM